MGKIVGWRQVTGSVEGYPCEEADYVVPADDASDGCLDEGTRFEEVPIQAQAVKSIDVTGEDAAETIKFEVEKLSEDSGTGNKIASARSQGIPNRTEIVCQYISKLVLVSYEDWPTYYFDITEASYKFIRRLIETGERLERLDYFRILEEIQDVVLRQAAQGAKDKRKLRSPNLNCLIEFVGDKMSAQR